MTGSAVSRDRLDKPIRGILLLVGGIAVFSLQDVIIRLLSGDYPVHEIVFFRSLVAIVTAMLFVWFDGGFASLRTGRLLLHLARGLVGFVSYTCYYMAIAAIPLADAVAITFSAPLFVTSLSPIFLREPVGPHRWGAVAVGFGGVIVIIRPGVGIVDPAAGLALVAALCYAIMILMTRRLGGSERASTMSFFTTTAFLALSIATGLGLGHGAFHIEGHASVDFLLRAWTVPDHGDLALMGTCGVIFGVGLYLLSRAYSVTEVSAITPFEYTAILWAAGWGYFIWQELPDNFALVGMVLVIGSGLYVVHREVVRGRKTVSRQTLRPRA